MVGNKTHTKRKTTLRPSPGKDDSEPFGKRCQRQAQGSLAVRSCGCGPESSTCVTDDGEVYVWGAASHYLFTGGGHAYARGEHCTLPVRVRGLPRAIGADSLIPSDVSVYRDRIACAVGHRDMEKEISSLQNSFKHRSKQLAALTKSKRRDAASAGQDGEADDLRLEELRELDKEFAKTAADMHQRLAAITRDWQRTTAELGDVAREVATCDQQDRALAERSGALQAAMQKAHNSSNPQLVGDLKDVTYFKESNRRTKLRYVERREELDRQEQHLAEEKQLAEREIKRVEGQRKMIRLLQRGELSSKSAATAALEAGFKAAARKRAELAASDPALLAGSGCFSGLTEVLQVADSAVDSTSTRLREVTTVSGGGASVVLEETLEAIVRLRTECIALARARLWRLQRSDRAPSLAPVLGDDSGAASPGASGVGASAQPSHRHHRRPKGSTAHRLP
ncbi:unnamed protein product [Prorocentrum cordatum]|uniref:Cilia- and flagella-associated protein 157 n=1 Tax=Prorocentrum cordatum TaxID=2364126 RepID=A0ABN9T2U5_9DINO|nr:unnamed protein product [Polarella glacialis]